MTTIMLVFGILIIAPLLIGVALNELTLMPVKEPEKKNKMNAVIYMSGILLMLVLFEGLSVVAIKLNLSLSVLSSLFMGMNCVLVMGALFVGRRKMPLVLDDVKKVFVLTPVKFAIAITAILLMLSLWVYEPFSMGHTVEETVLTTLNSGTLYECNPLTGLVMDNGMYPINQLYTTPLFEAVMIHVSGADATVFMEYMYPAFVIFAHLLVVWMWAREAACPKIYMLFYILFALFSENVCGLGSFSLLHESVAGNVFTMQVVVPFAVYVLCKRKDLPTAWWRVATLMLCMGAAIMNTNLIYVRKFAIFSNDKALMFTVVTLIICAIYFLVNGKKYTAKTLIPLVLLFVLASALGLLFMVASYVLSEIYADMQEDKLKKRVVVGAVLLIVLGGSVYLYTDGTAEKRDNSLTAEEQILERVLQYKEELGQDTIVFAGPREIMQIIRKKDASVLLPFGRDYWHPEVNQEIGDIYDDEAYALYANLVDMKDLINKDTVLTQENEEHLIRVASLSIDKGCDVFVTTAALPESGDARLIVEIDGYFLYSVVK